MAAEIQKVLSVKQEVKTTEGAYGSDAAVISWTVTTYPEET